MKNARTLLAELNKRFPVLDGKGLHALLYDPTKDMLVVQVNIHGALVPLGFTEQELSEDPIVLVNDIVAALEKKN